MSDKPLSAGKFCTKKSRPWRRLGFLSSGATGRSRPPVGDASQCEIILPGGEKE